MFRNVKNIRLIIILGILVLVYFGIKMLKNTSRSKSFRAELVVMDTARVDRMVITKSGTSFQVMKGDEGHWQVTIPGNRKVEATGSSVRNALSSLLRVEPDRIATRDPQKWSDYQVDSTGTRVQVYEGETEVLDLILGRFGIHGQQQFHTFVRLEEDDEVYVANDFMGVSFPTDPKGFRNTRFLQLNADSITQITFNYPADSAFILNRTDGNWHIGDEQPDSANVASYISGLRYLNARDFVDDVEPAALINPVLSLQIQSADQPGTVSLEAYLHPEHGYIMHSSYNPNAYFSDNTLLEKVFVGRSQLTGP